MPSSAAGCGPPNPSDTSAPGRWTLATEAVVWSDTLLELYGIDRTRAFGGDYATELGNIHPDDRAEVDAALDACLRTGEPMLIRHRRLPGRRRGDALVRAYGPRRMFEDGQFVRAWPGRSST